MTVIKSTVQRNSESFQANRAAYDQLLAVLRERVDVARAGGGAAAMERHRSRNKIGRAG